MSRPYLVVTHPKYYEEAYVAGIYNYRPKFLDNADHRIKLFDSIEKATEWWIEQELIKPPERRRFPQVHIQWQ